MVIPNYIRNSNYIGQEDSVSKINFFINQHKANKFIPPLALLGPRGFGKTELSRAIAKNLENREGQIKKYVEVNSSELKTIQGFIDHVYMPHINGNKETTLLLDEAHNIGRGLDNWLLSAFNTEKTNVNIVQYSGQDYEFNFEYLSVFIGTTNPEKLSQPFMSRFRRIELKPYKNEELALILESSLKDLRIPIETTPELNLEIASHCRGTPRQAVHLIKDIIGFCSQNNSYIFSYDDWFEMKKIMGIKPLNLSNQEFEVLKMLNTGSKTLTNLAARLKVDRITLQRDIESFLLSNNLITIDGKRSITSAGQAILKELN